MEYRRLTYADRQKFEKLVKQGKSVMEIAAAMKIHMATVYRELHRGGREYSADIAQKNVGLGIK